MNTFYRATSAHACKLKWMERQIFIYYTRVKTTVDGCRNGSAKNYRNKIHVYTCIYIHVYAWQATIVISVTLEGRVTDIDIVAYYCLLPTSLNI